jgi:hypothetical protein
MGRARGGGGGGGGTGGGDPLREVGDGSMADKNVSTPKKTTAASRINIDHIALYI